MELLNCIAIGHVSLGTKNIGTKTNCFLQMITKSTLYKWSAIDKKKWTCEGNIFSGLNSHCLKDFKTGFLTVAIGSEENYFYMYKNKEEIHLKILIILIEFICIYTISSQQNVYM